MTRCDDEADRTALLELRDVCKRFPAHGVSGRREVVAVDHVSAALHAGRTLGVVGASGSGKSTLGELAGGLAAPTSGAVLFRGQETARLPRAQRRAARRGVQFVFQDPAASMNPSFTVERVLVDPQRVLGRVGRAEARLRAAALLERVGLPEDVLGARPRELSGGQCQRVAIARALLPRPSVVVCDECTSALDVSVQAQILNLLRDLQDELSTAYLFIAHDMAAVGYMADDLLVMDAGRVVERGPAAQVMARPQQACTRGLVAAAFGGAGGEGDGVR